MLGYPVTSTTTTAICQRGTFLCVLQSKYLQRQSCRDNTTNSCLPLKFYFNYLLVASKTVDMSNFKITFRVTCFISSYVCMSYVFYMLFRPTPNQTTAVVVVCNFARTRSNYTGLLDSEIVQFLLTVSRLSPQYRTVQTQTYLNISAYFTVQ